MCGIAGVYAFGAGRPPAVEELSAMLGVLQHRGPDGCGTMVDGPVGLAHARLAIIDIDGGRQPIANEDQSIWVICNGEIFNFVELRRELEQRGHRFRTRSDTEVIVHLYEEKGERFVEALNGQFAIALWDSRARRLVLTRDPVGIRPLFYAEYDGRLAFGSEVKALFQLPLVRRLDVAGLASIFTYWSVLPPQTIFEGVNSLPPGHTMVVTETGVRTTRHWDWLFTPGEPEPRREEECAEELRALLVDAVRLQLRSDVPVAAYLSGGLDSSIITALIHRYTDSPVRSFSLTFESAEFDERQYQEEVARFLGISACAVPCRAIDIGTGFPRAVWHAESPLLRTAAVPMMLLADRVRAAGFRVVLSGEGADEVFAGYDLFKEAAIRRFMARQPRSAWRARLLERLYPYLSTSPASGRAMSARFFAEGASEVAEPWFAHIPRMNTTRRALQFLHADLRETAISWDAAAALHAVLPAGSGEWPAQSRDQYVEAQTLMSGYLLSSQGDRMAMAASVEARFPFLDRRVIEFGNRLPPQFKRRALREKRILKKAMAGDLPAGILARVKQPYRSPDSSSFFVGGRPLDYVSELLARRRVEAAGLFDAPAVERLLEKCRAARAVGFGDNMAFVGILSTMLLHEQFVARRPAAA